MRGGLKLWRTKSVAGGNRAACEACREPVLALLGAAVGEGVRYHIALHLFLQTIIADRRGRLERLFDVAGIEELVFLLSAIGPHAGEANGLQLDAHLQLVRFDLA